MMNKKTHLPPMSRALAIAMSQYGITEWTGIEHNPEVMKYFQEIGHNWVKDDETAWCAAFVNWVLLKAGIKGTGKLNAKSFLELGVDNNLEDAMSGDVIVLERGKPGDPYGHVGFLVHYDDHYIWLLGGNQGNQVNIAKYSRKAFLSARILQDPEPENPSFPAINI